MASSIRLEGIDALLKKFSNLSDKIQGQAVKRALVKAAAPTVAAAKEEAPQSDKDVYVSRKGKVGMIYKSGNLKKSIKVYRGKNKKWLNVQVGAAKKGKIEAFYATFVHEGHKKKGGGKTKENKFMERAAKRTEGQAVEIFERELKLIIEKTVK